MLCVRGMFCMNLALNEINELNDLIAASLLILSIENHDMAY